MPPKNVKQIGIALLPAEIEIANSAAKRTGLSRARVVGYLLRTYGPTLKVSAETKKPRS